MGSRVELFEQIRRDRDREGLSIRALAERHGVHRRAVRQALACPVPPARRSPARRPAPKLGAYRALIDGWLEADLRAPRKQRHTAKRIWARLVDEHGVDVAETTVRDYVRARKRAMGWPVGEVFVPQAHAPGVGGEVDWGEAHVDLAGVRTRVFLFFMRALFSGAAFCQASLVRTQQAFLELHGQAFEWFGGVFEEIRYDNLTSAVKSVLKGRRRVECDRFIALRSHYLFESQFTTPGIAGAHEKGGVEGEVGLFRRNHLVPIPAVASLEELNTLILAGCEGDLARRISGRPVSVGEAWAQRAAVAARAALATVRCLETAAPRVDSKALVTVRQNRYSVPVSWPGSGRREDRREEITISHAGQVVARHERLHGRYGTSAQLDHYLDLLARKPGGLERSLPLANSAIVAPGRPPSTSYGQRLAPATEASEAARQMVDVLMLVREHGSQRVEMAVAGALAAGAHDGRAVAVLARRAQNIRRRPSRSPTHTGCPRISGPSPTFPTMTS